MVHSNENVTQRRGGAEALLASRASAPPRLCLIFHPTSLLSFALLRLQEWPTGSPAPTGALSAHRSPRVNGVGSSAHRAPGSAAVAPRSACPWLAAAQR